MASALQLPPLPIGWQIDFFPSATSSSDLAYDALTSQGKQAHGRCFVVDEQTKGRGRRGRIWQSPIGRGLYFSAVLFPHNEKQTWPSLSFMVALALHSTLKEVIISPNSEIALKWPNDVLVNNKKIAGILLEAYESGVIIGCGVNIKAAPTIDNRPDYSIALDEVDCHRDIDNRSLAFHFVHYLSIFYQQWEKKGASDIIAQWISVCSMIDKAITIKAADKHITGICLGFGANGELYIEDEHKQQHTITTGDVELMKAQI